jgi:hypothetical protein
MHSRRRQSKGGAGRTIVAGGAGAGRAVEGLPSACCGGHCRAAEGAEQVAAVEQPANETAPVSADVPDAEAIADPPPKLAAAATPLVVPKVARAPIVKRRVVRNEHHRGYSGAYAQYGGTWSGGERMAGPGQPLPLLNERAPDRAKWRRLRADLTHGARCDRPRTACVKCRTIGADARPEGAEKPEMCVGSGSRIGCIPEQAIGAGVRVRDKLRHGERPCQTPSISTR